MTTPTDPRDGRAAPNGAAPHKPRDATTHRDVIERVAAAIENPRSAATFRSDCAAWCRIHNVDLDAPAQITLGLDFHRWVEDLNAHLAKAHPGNSRAGKNLRSAARKMRAGFAGMVAAMDLPDDFCSAFRLAMDMNNMAPKQLNRILIERYHQGDRKKWYGSRLWGYYEGTGRPGKSWQGDSVQLLRQIEEVLSLPPESMVRRAYPQIILIKDPIPTPIAYREMQSARYGFNYKLAKLPKHLLQIWNEYSDWRRKTDHMINGKIVTVDLPKSIWQRPGSEEINRDVFLSYLGWAMLPAPEGPISDLPEKTRWMSGLGLKESELGFHLLFNINILWQFLEFRRHRQTHKKHTKSCLQILYLANSFVSTAWCFLLGNPHHAEKFGITPSESLAEWANRVEQVHQSILSIVRGLKNRVAQSERSADEPLRHVLNDEHPYRLILEMIERAEDLEPLPAMKYSWSVWARDMAILQMQVEIPLRSLNTRNLRIGINLIRESPTQQWRLFVPKEDLKNHFSEHAHNIDRLYSKETSEAIDRYINFGRENLCGAESDLFLLATRARFRKNAPENAINTKPMSEDGLYSIYAKHLGRHFGRTQGSNFFRHLMATSILKDDPTQVEVAAAVLNNSPKILAANYDHLIQGDMLRLADRWMKNQSDAKRRRQKRRNKRNPPDNNS